MEEQAVFEGFGDGICCGMAVFGEFAERFGVPKATARRIAAGFGSGMGRGSSCGCVLGGLMVLGLAYGNCEEGDLEGKARYGEKRAEFYRRFLARFGAPDCRTLLGHNPADAAELAVIREKGLMRSICAPMVCETCDILRALLED